MARPARGGCEGRRSAAQTVANGGMDRGRTATPNAQGQAAHGGGGAFAFDARGGRETSARGGVSGAKTSGSTGAIDSATRVGTLGLAGGLCQGRELRCSAWCSAEQWPWSRWRRCALWCRVKVGRPATPRPRLSPAQQHAFQQIEVKLAAPDGVPVLLLGVTGSGKTEVYNAGD